jgi:uncharacterized protein DUF3105
MASGTKNKGKPKNSVRAARSVVKASKPKPWGMIAAVVIVVVLAVGVFGYAFMQISEKNAREEAQQKYVPSDTKQDPSDQIPGVVKTEYKGLQHVSATQRVAYDKSPPYGGPHDNVWADCSGIVYDKAVRTENMVHALEHGAVWIAYNPDKVKGDDLDALKKKVDGQQYLLMSPYPGLDKPISLQSWGHQLKVTKASDERIDDFITALRQNKYQNPEPNGRCDSQGTGFDVTNPPPFDPNPPGADAVKMDGTGATPATGESGMTGGATPPPAGSTPPPSQ